LSAQPGGGFLLVVLHAVAACY